MRNPCVTVLELCGVFSCTLEEPLHLAGAQHFRVGGSSNNKAECPIRLCHLEQRFQIVRNGPDLLPLHLRLLLVGKRLEGG